MKKLTSSSYTKDQLYPSVARAMAEILAAGAVVAPVEVLLRMGRIKMEQYEDWRFGRIPYLERVCSGSLGKMNRILRILDRHARSLGLTPSQTVYHKWGRGGKRIVLRFSKSGQPNLEAAYSRHNFAKNRLAAEASRRKPEATGDAAKAAQPDEVPS
jgi:hypothetical protein